MRNLNRKLVAGVLLSVILLAVSCFVLIRMSTGLYRKAKQSMISVRTENSYEALDSLFSDYSELNEYLIQQMEASVDLETVFLKEQAAEGAFTGPILLNEDMILFRKGDQLLFPDGFSSDRLIISGGFPSEEEEGIFPASLDGEDGSEVLAICRKLSEGIYFMRLMPMDTIYTYAELYMDIRDTLGSMEQIYRGKLLVLDEQGQPWFEDSSGFFPEDCTAESLGLDLTGDPSVPRAWIREGATWNYIFSRLESRKMTLVFFYSQEAASGMATDSSLLILAIQGLIAIALITWHISVQKMVRNKVLSENEYRIYHPRRVRHLAAVLGLVSVLAVGLTAYYISRIDTLHMESSSSEDALESIKKRISLLPYQDAGIHTLDVSSLERKLSRAAVLLSEHPSLQTRETLQKINTILDCDYLMLFDGDGNEVLSSADYTGFTLGSSPEDEMYPFLRLTMGVEFWFAEEKTDQVTGLSLQKIGVRVPVPGSERYGVLLAAVDPQKLQNLEKEHEIDDILQTVTPADSICLAVNRDTGRVSHASNHNMVGRTAESLRLDAGSLRNSGLCCLTADGQQYYGASQSIDDDIYFYCVSSAVLSQDDIPFALLSAAFALVLYFLLSAFLLWGYTGKNFEHDAVIGNEEVHGHTVEIVTSDGRIKRSVDPAKRWESFGYRWKDMLPGEKTKLVLQCALLIVMLVSVFRLLSGDNRSTNILGYLLSGTWDHGFNLFAIAASALMTWGAMTVYLLLKLIVQFICTFVGTKSETIFRLLIDLVGYIILFTLLFYVFNCFGIDTSALIGATAVISLAISIGSKDIVADIIAGITIVFEGDYQVGDIVEIGGYTGTVQEIGVRSTKLIGKGDNVKIISNRDVKNVLNMSRYNSWYAIELNISTDYDLAALEKLLQQELSVIGSRIKEIISGPIYKGVEDIGRGSFRITILAECREDDIRSVRRQLNREIRLLFTREHVPIV